MIPNRNVVGRSFIHSCHIPKTPDGGDAVVVSEHLHFDTGDVEPSIRVIKNPQRTIYVTKKKLRSTHTDKKEREHIANLDRFTVPNSKMLEQAHKAIFGYAPRSGIIKPVRDKILESPYLYGAGVDIQSLIKIKYRKDFEKAKLNLHPITTGVLDTEISLVRGREGELLCMTFTHENQVFTTINENWFYKNVDGNKVKATLEELSDLSQKTLTPVIDEMLHTNKNLAKLKHKFPFKYHYHLSKSVPEMLKWSFARIHENQTTFMGIWNLGYDIGQIVRICREYGIDPKELFSHPEVPEDYQYFHYREDKKKVAHLADKWHWVSAPAMVQFVDFMAIYNKLRVVDGKETSYKLDYILKKNGLSGKLTFPHLEGLARFEGTQDWHREMSLKHFLEYVVYNQADSIFTQCMEWLNSDTTALRILSNNTGIDKFPRQTVKNQDTLFREWIDKEWIIGTPSGDMTEDHDDEIEAEGGAVLDSFRVDKTGLRIIEEYPNQTTQIHAFVSDADFSQMYPTVMERGNIAKETRSSTVIAVTGDCVKVPVEKSVETLYSYLISIEGNAHALGCDFFNLPEFDEMNDAYMKMRESL